MTSNLDVWQDNSPVWKLLFTPLVSLISSNIHDLYSLFFKARQISLFRWERPWLETLFDNNTSDISGCHAGHSAGGSLLPILAQKQRWRLHQRRFPSHECSQPCMLLYPCNVMLRLSLLLQRQKNSIVLADEHLIQASKSVGGPK